MEDDTIFQRIFLIPVVVYTLSLLSYFPSLRLLVPEGLREDKVPPQSGPCTDAPLFETSFGELLSVREFEAETMTEWMKK